MCQLFLNDHTSVFIAWDCSRAHSLAKHPFIPSTRIKCKCFMRISTSTGMPRKCSQGAANLCWVGEWTLLPYSIFHFHTKGRHYAQSPAIYPSGICWSEPKTVNISLTEYPPIAASLRVSPRAPRHRKLMFIVYHPSYHLPESIGWTGIQSCLSTEIFIPNILLTIPSTLIFSHIF